MKKLPFVKTKTIKEVKMSPEVLKDLIDNKTEKPKFDDLNKENQKNIQKILNKSELIVAIIGEKMITGIPFSLGSSMGLLPIPDLISFYLNSASSLFNQSEELLVKIKTYPSVSLNGVLIAETTNGIYYQFLMLRITVYFYLAILIEYVINKNLPEFVTKDGKQIQKEQIEQKFLLAEKIKILREKGICKLDHHDQLYQKIMRCYQLRSNLFHPKTSNSNFDNENAFKIYPEIISDCEMHIVAVTQLIEIIEPELLEWI